MNEIDVVTWWNGLIFRYMDDVTTDKNIMPSVGHQLSSKKVILIE